MSKEKIKKEYLQGATPKELSAKYKVDKKKISNWAYEENWTSKKQDISEKIEKNFERQLETLTTKALETIQDVLNTSTDNKDRIAAARAALDVSGLKSNKTENTVVAKSGLTIEVKP